MEKDGHGKEISTSDPLRRPLTSEAEQQWIPFATSPFVDGGDTNPTGERVAKPAGKLPWSDLLLEVAMTTAFASLTNGTPILRRTNVLSYLSFFALVWWTWASQVAYNVRLRQDDWIHRLFAFLQLLVFAGLAAFTNGFDITSGIRYDKDQDLVESLMEKDLFVSKADLAASRFRNDRLPTLNARGISFVMGCGRLVLLSQYGLAIYHAREGRYRSLCVHVVALLFSATSYFATYIVIGNDPSKADNAIKIVLWYLPILIEILSHFWANSERMPGRVRYSFDTIMARASSSFVIILGGGLDKITNTFQYIVGNVSIDGKGAGLIFSAMTIFTAQFMLYFGMIRRLGLGRRELEPSDRRCLIWFFSHYFYLSALIVTLQAVAALLVFGNIIVSLDLPVSKMVSEIGPRLLAEPFEPLNMTNFADLQEPLSEIGMALESIVKDTNTYTNASNPKNNQSGAFNDILQWSVAVSYVSLRNLDAVPELNSPLDARISVFLAYYPTNTTMVNANAYTVLIEEILYERGKPVLWFFGAAGLTLLTLASLSFILNWPRNNYEWGVAITRIIFGTLVASLAILSYGAGKVSLNADWQFTGSKIWDLALSFWVLPMFAITLVVEQLIEVGLMIFKRLGMHRKAPGSCVSDRSKRLSEESLILQGANSEHPSPSPYTDGMIQPKQIGGYMELRDVKQAHSREEQPLKPSRYTSLVNGEP